MPHPRNGKKYNRLSDQKRSILKTKGTRLVMEYVLEMKFSQYFFTVLTLLICKIILRGDVKRNIVAFTENGSYETDFLVIVIIKS